MKVWVLNLKHRTDRYNRITAALDKEGVGELLLLARDRGREQNPILSLSVCGEHGGDPASIKFCCEAGFNYVSCSSFRVPIAILAAAHYELEK